VYALEEEFGKAKLSTAYTGVIDLVANPLWCIEVDAGGQPATDDPSLAGASRAARASITLV
jgi:hypothetical protein